MTAFHSKIATMLPALLLIVVSTARAAPPPKQSGPAPIAKQVSIGQISVRTDALPAGLVLRERLGLVCHELVDGQLVHETAHDGIYHVQCTITPGGDYLLVFPEGRFYATSLKKVNDLMGCRSNDKGKTWSKPAPLFQIDYSQHGFVPLIPRGTKRLYAFGTQPIPGKWTLERGLAENAPIGYRWSDDDGRTWSDVRLIDPVNDPTFTGMSVMRMCETDAGTWLIGSHEGDWSVKPLRTRQYILRSEDQGKTWTVLPDKRPNGWFVEGFDRMDEGRLISLGGKKVLMMARTAAWPRPRTATPNSWPAASAAARNSSRSGRSRFRPSSASPASLCCHIRNVSRRKSVVCSRMPRPRPRPCGW